MTDAFWLDDELPHVRRWSDAETDAGAGVDAGTVVGTDAASGSEAAA